MRQVKRPQFFLLLTLILFVLLALVLTVPEPAGAVAASANEDLSPVVELIEVSGAYQFTAQVEQTLIPRPLPANFGKTEERYDFQLNGEITLPDSAVLDLQFEAGADNPPIRIERNGPDTYLVHNGERVQIENPLSPTTTDFVGYLHAAENIQEVENAEQPQLTIYAFDINGGKFADYLMGKMQSQLPADEQGGLLQTPPVLQQMTGHGELWIDADGYPQRQILNIFTPEANKQFDAQTHMVIDYRYDAALSGVTTVTSENVLAGDPAGSPTTAAITTQTTTGETGRLFNVSFPTILVAGLLSALVILFVINLIRSHRWLYRTVPIGMVILLVATPILQPISAAQAQENEEATAPPTLEEALGLSEDTETDEPEVEPPQMNPNVPVIEQQLLVDELTCGAADVNTDTDLDGLNDFVEACLGTDPFTFDTDEDGITDTLEVAGFVFTSTLGITTTFYSNPHEADTNRDGLHDYEEWPEPIGTAPTIDPDGDDIPNLWDDDNDGDGVPDREDMDPFSVTAYQSDFALLTSLNGSSYNGYQYIEFQVQPQDESHMRLALTELDWPYDDVGTIQAHDVTKTDELSFSPILKVTANKAPFEDMRAQYSISAVDKDDGYEMLISLMPIVDGGRITAFQGRVAYAPAQLGNIDWSKIEFGWMAYMENSISTDGESTSEQVPVAEYLESSFRFTGLKITKSGDTRYAIIGTPNSQADHRPLANLLMGLEASYLNAANPDFDEIVARFSTPSTPISETWGVPASDIAVALPQFQPLHMDHIFQDYSNSAVVIRELLNDNGYNTGEMASLVTALEAKIGSDSLDTTTALSGNQFTFNLATIPLATMRSVQLSHYTFENNLWGTPDDVDAINSILAGYNNDPALILADLQATYPDLTQADLIVLLSGFYASWMAGQATVVEIDGVPLVTDSADDGAISGQINLSETDLLTYIIEANELALANAGLVFANLQTYYQFRNTRSVRGVLRANAIRSAMWQIYKGWQVYNTIKEGKYFLRTYSYTVDSWLRAFSSWEDISNRISYKLKNAGWKKTGNFIYKKIFKFFSRTKNTMTRLARIFTKLGYVASAILFVVSMVFIWTTYAKFHSPYDYEENYALAYAIVDTILITILTIFAFTGVGMVLVLALVVLDLIVYAITSAFGTGIDSIVTTSITKLFADIRAYTKYYEADFEGISINNEYVVAGGTLTLSDVFDGWLVASHENSLDQLNQSYIDGFFRAQAGSGIDTDVDNYNVTDKRCENWTNPNGLNFRNCTNGVSADYTFTNAGRDQKIEFMYTIRAETRYVHYALGGIIAKDKTDIMDLPDELEEEDQWSFSSIYVDVLPNTLSGLLNWSELSNDDLDGDGVDNITEAVLSTIPPTYPGDIDGDGLINGRDWDRDGDTLEDGFEAATQNTTGADPNEKDADGDGLHDGIEFYLGTGISTADHDADGLTDGEEWFHWDGTAWTGGGWYVTIDNVDYWVFANPFAADTDKDGIADGSEKLNGTSPYAINDAPQLQIDAGPLYVNGSGLEAVYAHSGDTITTSLNLYNTGALPVTTTLSLCLPASLSNVNVTTSGDRVPVTQVNGNCYDWDFAANNLLPFQRFNADVSALAGGGTLSDTIKAEVPYPVDGTPQPVTNQIHYVEDNTIPTIQMTDPLTGTILNSQFYVVAGFTQDADSWVDHVDVTVPAGTFPALLTDSQWGYTWDLPDDGFVTVSAVATDVAGNASNPVSIEVIVDTLDPVITVNLAEGETISAGESYSTTIPLSGTVTDNFAGIARVQLRYNQGIWRTIWDDAGNPLNANWNGLWELPTLDTAQGEHSLYLRAYDAFGNIGHITRTVFIDVLPPTNGLTNRAFVQETPQHVAGGQPVPLYGVASDAGNNPLPADPANLSGDLHSITDATIWLQVDSLTENDGGAFVNWLGDNNGDRLGDLAVGLPGANGGAGKVVVVNGMPGDWPIPNIGELEFLNQNTPSFVGTTGAGIGEIIAPAGDVNGDGVDDMLVGDPANDRVMLILGYPAGGAFHQPLDGSYPRQIEILTDLTGESLGTLTSVQVAGAGDVTNDGLSDILVSVSGTTNGAVYLLAGNTMLTSPQTLDTLAAAKLVTGPAGAAVAGVGDVNDDFIPDFAVAMGNTVYLFAGGGGWAQAGLTSLSTAAAMATLATADGLPTILGAGDINGDNIDDFAFTSGSTPVVVFGNAAETFSMQTLSGFASPLSGFLAAVGDVDEDGRGDLLIGNDDDDAYLLLGSDLSSVAATIEGVATAASAPYVAGADLAGDGSSDLAVVPSATAAAGLGYDGFGSIPVMAPFIDRNALSLANGQANGQTGAGPARPDSGNGRELESILSSDVIVAPIGGDYTNIQAAINSGASRVLVEPGIYAEAITLTNNVTLIGSGADRTVLTFPGGYTGTTLVSADSVNDAALLNLTLNGDGSIIGLAANNGATNIRLERVLIQNMGTAAAVDGSTTTLALKNNTIAGNVDGFLATNNAGVDIRNTIFAFNTGTALQYDAGAVQQLHQYNLYYANGTDLSPNNPGGGELFSNPLFLDYGAGDFRTETFSPVIDAGTPNDPVPPGAGSAIDIGHREQTGSSFFADDDYCDVCINDGLLWGVDAFATIQDAVDAAQNDIANLQVETPIQFAVGVNNGVYTESVVISTSVQLLGQGPDQTTIQGDSGPAVTFQAAVNAGVTGFTLVGGGIPIGVLMQGGSNTIAIDYNLIQNNTTGISVTQRSTGNATFNTIISNTTGVDLARGTFFNTYDGFPDPDYRRLEDSCKAGAILCEERGFLWLDISNSIISGNAIGLSATGQSVLFSDFNLLDNTVNYTNVINGANDIIGQDPLLVGEHSYLQAGSPAVDQGDPGAFIPAGGGSRPDLGWHELLAAPISVFMGRPDESLAAESIGVGQVEYAIVPVAMPTMPVTATLPTTWTLATLNNPGEKATYWQTSYNAAADGYYRLYSRAADLLGNAETDVEDWYDGAFVVDSVAPVVTMSLQSYDLGNWLLMEADVVDYIGTSFDVDDIYFTMDGERVDGRWNIEEWTPDGSSPRTFRYFFQNTTGMDLTEVEIQAFAVDGAGNVGSSAVQSGYIPGDFSDQFVDTIAPIWITVTTPLPGAYVSNTVVFTGTAWDAGAFFAGGYPEHDSQTSGIELSFDGGVTWAVASSYRPTFGDPNYQKADRVWEYEWAVPAGLDATTIPVRVRATDNAGLFRSEIITVTLDTGAPHSFKPVTFNYPLAVFLDSGEVITGVWDAPLDGSGWVTPVVVGENPDGTLLLGDIGQRSVSDVGSEGTPVFFRIGERDEASNVVYDYFGDWNAGSVAAGPDWMGFQRLIRDGFMDIDHDEWLTATEFLDDDERPERTQNLWVTWDHLFSFIGWQGGTWGPDGTLWAYYDLVAGGSSVDIETGRLLPFAADFAVSAVDADTAYLWTYETGSSSWISETMSTPNTNPFEPEYGHDPDTETTEIRVWFDFLNTGTGSDWNRMLAYATNPAGDVWSAFPTINELNGNFDYFYEWDKGNGTFYLLDQPTRSLKPAVAMTFESDPPVQDTVSYNTAFGYVATLTSLENHAESGIQLLLNASPGITYQTVTGAATYDCSAGTSCSIDLPTIPAWGTQVVTITAVPDLDLTGIEQITTTVQVVAGDPLPDTHFTRMHNVDIAPPTVTINPYPGNVAGSSIQTVFGSAYDGIGGAGVAYVEVSTDGTNWQLADGTHTWTAEVIPPGGPTWPHYARATDLHNQTSTPVTVTMIEDIYAPIVTATVPALVGGNGVFHHFNDTTQDPIPPGAKVAEIEMQIDNSTATWKTGSVFNALVDGEQHWSLIWWLPNEDGVTHTVRFRATDYGENVTTTGWYTTVVDTIAPVITVTQHMTQVAEGGVLPALAGTISDGSGIGQVGMLIYPQFGSASYTTANLTGDQWSFVPALTIGHYSIFIAPEDSAGNDKIIGPFAVEVVEAPPLGFTGDTSCDGSRNVIDALYIMQYEVGLRTASSNCPPEEDTLYLPACDVNGDAMCNVIDALFIMQCEVGIPNSLCPTVAPNGEQTAAETAAAEEGAPGITIDVERNLPTPATITAGSAELAAGETVNVPVSINVPAGKNLTALTLDIDFDPTVVSFDSCQPNEGDFTLNLCNLSEGDGQNLDTVTFTALHITGINGDLLLGELSFTGVADGMSDLFLEAHTYEDGSGESPVLVPGLLTVGEEEATLPAAVYATGDSAGMTTSGLAYGPEDILLLDSNDGAWSLFFDGAVHGLDGADIDGFHIRPNGSILLSLAMTTTLPNGFAATPEDILQYRPVQDRFGLVLDGSDVGLAGNNIDGVTIIGDQLIVSLSDAFDGYSAADVLRFEHTSLGQNTAGRWALQFDTDSVSGLAGSETNGIWARGGNMLYLTSSVSFGSGHPALIYNTRPVIFLDLNEWGLNAVNVNGFHLDPAETRERPDLLELDNLE